MATLTTSFQLLGESYVGNINWGGGSSNLYLRLYGRYTQQSIANNNHICEFQSRIYCSGYYVYTSNCYASIDGVSVQNNSSLNFPTNGELTLGTITRTIGHNADGTKTDATSSASFSGYGISGGNVSVTFALPTIPRASGVACTSANIGETATITIDRKSDTFKHTLSYDFYGVTGPIASRTANTIEPFELPSTFYSKIPNAPSGTGTIYCTTYDSAGNQVGDTTSCSFTAYVNKDNNKPDLTISVVDTGITLPTGVTTTSLTGSNKKLINNWSSAKVTATATGKNSATIKSTKVISGDGQSSTSLTPTFTKVHSSTFTVSATDSRGIANTATATGMSLIPYTEIQTTTVKLKRESQTSSVVTIELAGKYFNGSFGSVTNDITLKYRYRVVGGSWSGYTSLSLTKSSGTFSYKNTSLRTDCDYQTAYEFQFVLTDKVNVYTLTLKDITKGIPVFDYGEDDFNINVDGYIKDFRMLEAGDTIGTYNYIQDTNWNTKLTKPSTNYSQFNFPVTHPMVNIRSTENHTYCLSFEFVPSASGYKPCTAIVVGGIDGNDAWAIRPGFGESEINLWKISKCNGYYKYSRAFVIAGDGVSYLGDYVRFLIESADINVGGTIRNVRLQEGQYSVDERDTIATFQGRVGTTTNRINFDDAITTGVYSVGSTESVTGAPYTGAIYGILEVKVSDMTAWNKTNNWIWQKFTATSGATYIRHAVNDGSFTAWKTIYAESDRATIYNNSTGTNGTVTLSASAANYNYLDIYFKNNNDTYGYTRVYSPNNKTVCLYSQYASNSSDYNEWIPKYANVLISGTSITKINYGEWSAVTQAIYPYNYTYITKIVGHTI